MKTSIFTNIRAKIIALMLLGIAGMLIITTTNIVFDQKKDKNIEVGRNSQMISELILKMVMIEERFIASGDKTQLADLTELNEKMHLTLKSIEENTSDTKILEVVTGINSLSETHSKIFAETSQNLTLMNKGRADFRNTNETLIKELWLIIAQIDETETLLLMEGEFIKSEEKLLQGKLKDLISFDGTKTINLLNLISSGDSKDYLLKSKDLSVKLKKMTCDIEAVLAILDSNERNNSWNTISTFIKNNKIQEDLIYKFWGNN
ncbi:hypothetical protein KAI46_04095, partial [bacterium]|nr:hypothetical protein [bacterium]